jgi:hypothetical protein
MKYLVALDGSKDSEMAFDVVLSKATQEDHVFLLMVAEEVYISTVAGASAYIDYSYIVRANQKIEEEGKALLKSYGRRLTERKVLAPPPMHKQSCFSRLAVAYQRRVHGEGGTHAAAGQGRPQGRGVS